MSSNLASSTFILLLIINISPGDAKKYQMTVPPVHMCTFVSPILDISGFFSKNE